MTLKRIIRCLELRPIELPEIWYRYAKKRYRCKWRSALLSDKAK